MKPKLIILFLLIVIIPLLLLVWFSSRLAQGENEKIKSRYNKLLTDRLTDINSVIERFIKKTERDFVKLIDNLNPITPEKMRLETQRNRLTRQIFIIETNGKLSFPKQGSTATYDEADFFVRTKSIWDSRVRFVYPDKASERQSPKQGWYSWFWGSGIHLIFWKIEPSGRIIGIEVTRIAFMSDILNQLPLTDPLLPKLPSSRIVLADAKDKPIYQWGAYQPDRRENYRVRLTVTNPLTAWSLKFYISKKIISEEVSSGILYNIISGIIVITLSLIALAYYFYRENTREIREATQKVSFVNKVSHELKTPLTNIRMYAEFLEETIPEDDKQSHKYAQIVISECQRLTRLIHNVLSFAKKQNEEISLHKSVGYINSVIESVIESFQPTLEAKNVDIDIDLERMREISFDPDVVKQILGNLISNVEKYGFTGRYLKIKSWTDQDKTIITVSDKGPGIPKDKLEDIFKPFVRLSDKLTDGITGTGIGLSISRDLARLHGGDLTVESTPSGTSFYVELNCKRRSV